jgi:hypothetical protein
VRSPSVKATPSEDLRAELNRRRAGEDAPISLERPDDLRAELNRRRASEDARVSLERARERRLNFQGRNLDKTSLRLRHKLQGVPESTRVSHWSPWAVPR